MGRGAVGEKAQQPTRLCPEAAPPPLDHSLCGSAQTDEQKIRATFSTLKSVSTGKTRSLMTPRPSQNPYSVIYRAVLAPLWVSLRCSQGKGRTQTRTRRITGRSQSGSKGQCENDPLRKESKGAPTKRHSGEPGWGAAHHRGQPAPLALGHTLLSLC